MVVVLPAPFGPRKPRHRARLDVEGEVVDGEDVAVAFAQATDFDHVAEHAPSSCGLSGRFCVRAL